MLWNASSKTLLRIAPRCRTDLDFCMVSASDHIPNLNIEFAVELLYPGYINLNEFTMVCSVNLRITLIIFIVDNISILM